MKILLTLGSLLTATAVLSGCSPEEREMQKSLIQSKLPRGCMFEYLGAYGDLRVATIQCKSKRTSDTLTRWQSGKVGAYALVTVIEDES